MKAGVCTIAMKDRTIAAALEACARSGAGGVEIWGRPGHLPPRGDRAGYARIREQLADAGLEAAALGSYYRPDGAAQSAAHASADDPGNPDYVLEAISELRCPVVRIWAGDRGYDATAAADREAIYDQVRLFAERARAVGAAVVLERHNGTLTDSWSSASRVIDDIGSDNVFLCYQVPYPVPPDDLRSKTAADFAQLLPRSAHAHLQNYVDRVAGRLPRALLGNGIVDYTAFGSCARSASYEGWAMVEFVADERGNLTEDQALAADVAFIRSL